MATITCPKCQKINTAFEGKAREKCPICGLTYSTKATQAIAKPHPKVPKDPLRQNWLTKYAWPYWIPLAAGCGSLVLIQFGGPETAAGLAAVPLLAVLWMTIAFVARQAAAAMKVKSQPHGLGKNFFETKGHAAEDVTPSFDGKRAVVIDGEVGLVYLYDSIPLGQVRKLQFSDVLKAELFEDGETISLTGGGASIGRAIVGGALFGVAGEIIGGATGTRKTKSTTFANLIEVRISLKDFRNPLWNICFLDRKTNRLSAHYREASMRARSAASLT